MAESARQVVEDTFRLFVAQGNLRWQHFDVPGIIDPAVCGELADAVIVALKEAGFRV